MENFKKSLSNVIFKVVEKNPLTEVCLDKSVAFVYSTKNNHKPIVEIYSHDKLISLGIQHFSTHVTTLLSNLTQDSPIVFSGIHLANYSGIAEDLLFQVYQLKSLS